MWERGPNLPIRCIIIAMFSSPFPNLTFPTMNSCSKSTAENQGRDWWLIARMGEVFGSVGLVMVNFGKMWMGFKYSCVIFDKFEWLFGGFRWFLLISGWLRLIYDGFRLFALWIVTHGKFVYSSSFRQFLSTANTFFNSIKCDR